MGNKKIFNINKEERLAFLVLMFFTLAWLSPVIWDNFDRTKEVIAQNTSIEMGYAQMSPEPSATFIIEDFFSRIDYFDFEGASELIHNEIKSEDVIGLFEGIYHITATNIVVNEETKDSKNFLAIVNTMQKEKVGNPFFSGTDTISITLKKTDADEWKIYKISRL
jgi:hypothetical protein